ncbi:hypothetical protein GC177_05305 [bacterium]|nr:hypothetical protein [bacterium]
MNDDELVHIVTRHLDAAKQFAGQLQGEREQVLDYFLGKPLGNEVEGRSKVVSTDVAETIDWLMPSLMRQFTGEKSIVQFHPVGDEDVDSARQVGAYCRHVYQVQNDGFLNTHSWIQDALLHKNGYLKVWWDESVEEEREEYSGREEDEALLILSDPDIRVLRHECVEQEDGRLLHDLAVIRRHDASQIRVQSLPPEHVLVPADYHGIGLNECPFVCHREYRTVSDLLIDGYDREAVEAAAEADGAQDGVTRARNLEGQTSRSEDKGDPSMRRVWVYECYIKVDVNGDGIAELRRVLLAGDKARALLANDVVDAVPIISLTALPMAHRHYGRSIAELVMELQKIKTALWRQMLDSLYLSNNPRVVADKHRVNLDDLMTGRIGGIVRGDPSAVTMLNVPFVGQQALPVLDYLDSVREERSGVSKTMQGLDPAALRDQSIYGMSALMGAAQQKIELIARVFAETGFKELFQRIFSLISKYESSQHMVELNGRRVLIDPRAWRKKRDLTISIGLGNVALDERRQALEAIAAWQEKIVQIQGGAMGENAILVDIGSIHNTLSDLVECYGLKQAGRYFREPLARLQEIALQQQLYAAPPPAPDAALQLAQADLARRAQEDQRQFELDVLKHRDEMLLEREKLQLQAAKLQAAQLMKEDESAHG